jgi:hypothetical protein
VAGWYAGYFDESGTDARSKVVGVAGIISDVARWEAFSAEWEEAIREFGLKDNPGYFHMTDFESPHAAPYKDWPKHLKRERLNKLLDIILKYQLSSVGCLIPKDLFESIIEPYAKAVCGGPYGLAAMDCFHLLQPTLIRVDGWMEYVFEDGVSGGKGELLTLYDPLKAYGKLNMSNLRMLSLVFRDKRKYVPLQAADMLVYELVKEFPRHMGWEKRLQPRYPLKRLREDLTQWHYLDVEQLRYWNQALLNLPVINK